MSLSSFFEKIGQFVNSNRWLVFIGFIVLIFVSIYGASGIVMYSGMDTYIQKDSKMYQDLDHYNTMFSQESIVIMVEGANATSPAVLNAADRFESIIANVPGVNSVISPTTIIKATNEQVTGRSEIPSSAQEIQALIALNPDVYSHLIYDNTHFLILVSYGDLSEEQKTDILSAARDAVDFAAFPPGYNVIVTGESALSADMNIEMMSGMVVLLALAILLMIVALSFVFKGVRWRLYPLIVVIFGLIFTFGAMGFLKINMTMVSIAAFPVLIGLGIDYAVQFHNRMEEELRRCFTRKEAIVSTFKHMGPAVLTALLVTCVSFVSLLTASIPMIRDFGKLLIIGCIVSYTAALFFGVVSLYFMDKLSERIREKEMKTGQKTILSRFFPALNKQKNIGVSDAGKSAAAQKNIITSTLNRVIDFTLKHKKTIFMVAIVTGALGVYADSSIPAETDFKTYIPQDMPALIDFYHMGSVLGGNGTINIMIQTSDISSPYVLKWMDEFGTYQVANQDYVYSADSLANVVKQYNGGVIPDTPEEIRAIYDKIPDSVMSQYSYGNSMLLLNLNVGSAINDLQMAGVKTLVAIVQDDLSWHPMPPGTTATITGSTIPYTELLDSLLSGRIRQTLLGVLLMFIALLVVYRDFYKALGPVLTIGLVIGWSGLIMYAFNIVYTPMTAVMGCMILGAGSEYSILLMERFYEEKEKGLTAPDAIRTAVTNTGVALIVSGMTTIFGFMALMASVFSIISSFGLVTVINMLMTLLATFIIFPPLLLTFDSFKEKGLRKTLEGFKVLFFSMIKANKKTEMV
ncbi:MAG: RND family transporter [Methanimicrococcus sp.]|nr:RND family transporter [Methanimicrococcus sp.]